MTLEKIWSLCGCDISSDNRHRGRDLENFIENMVAMVVDGHISNWEHDGEQTDLTKCVDPWGCEITFHTAKWQRLLLDKINEKKAAYIEASSARQVEISIEDFKPLTLEQIKEALGNSGLTISGFAKKAGISRKSVSAVINGKAPAGHEISGKIRKVFMSDEINTQLPV